MLYVPQCHELVLNVLVTVLVLPQILGDSVGSVKASSQQGALWW